MVSVIGGAGKAVQVGLTDLGFDGVMFVSARSPTERLERKKEGYSRGLRTSDLEAIEGGRELLQAAAPVVSGREVALINGRSLEVNVDGITPAYGVIRNRGAQIGRFLVDRDLEMVAPVAVIGSALRKQAYGEEDPLGREITIRGVRFRVVGVIRSLGNEQVDDDEMRQDNSKIYIPLTTMQKHFTGSDSAQAFMFKVRDIESLKDGQKEAEALLRRSHRGITDFKVQNIGEEILRVRKEVDVLIANWRVVLASIAGISLLVGGIGIFSVMQISIGERTYEIGLRKAMGASDHEVFIQFLLEACVLAALGASVGTFLGAGVCQALSSKFPYGLVVNPVGLLIAWATALLLAVVFGLYPAIRASRLSPMEAMR